MGAGRAEAALDVVNEAISEAEQIGQSWFDAELYRARGELLLQCGQPETTASEAAFKHAIDVAQRQQTRAFELRAATSLAKLYQSTDRSADAHTILATALEGFLPTLEFPEIAEAQALLAKLAETDEVKHAAAHRERRLKLQTSYSQAMMWSKGYGAEDTRAAFVRARDLSATTGSFANRSVANYGYWANCHMRGAFKLAREAAEIFLQEAENEVRMPEVSIARRMLGFTCLFLGNFTESRAHLEEALRIYNSGWNSSDKFRINVEPGVAAMAYLAEAEWVLGNVRRARNLIDKSVAGAIEAAHVPTPANSYNVMAEHEMFRGDVDAAFLAGKIAFEYSREHELGHYLPMAKIFSEWARARLGEREPSLSEMRIALATHREHGNSAYVPLFLGLIAEIEAASEGVVVASARIDEALALAAETGEHWTDSFLHRIRGEILLKCDPANTAPADEAFLTAIAIAQGQKARSFELRAAMSMARLWHDRGKPQQARELLAPIYGWFTEGFDTHDLKEAKALLDELHA
jgi:predicted ATPase